MANLRLAWSNVIDASGVVFTPTSEASGLPAKNLANELRTKVWRTGTSVAAENVVIDLGSAKSVSCVILLDHDLTAGDSAIALEANSSDAWGAPPFSQTLTRVPGAISAWFATQTYRYWRLKFTKSAAGETRQIGRVFLGTYYECERDVAADGLDIRQVDLTKSGKSIGGQRFSDARSSYDEISLAFSRMPQSQFDQLRTIATEVGEHRSFFISIDYVNHPEDWLYYVVLKDLISGKSLTYGNGSLLWDANLSLEEQL